MLVNCPGPIPSTRQHLSPDTWGSTLDQCVDSLTLELLQERQHGSMNRLRIVTFSRKTSCPNEIHQNLLMNKCHAQFSGHNRAKYCMDLATHRSQVNPDCEWIDNLLITFARFHTWMLLTEVFQMVLRGSLKSTLATVTAKVVDLTLVLSFRTPFLFITLHSTYNVPDHRHFSSSSTITLLFDQLPTSQPEGVYNHADGT